MTRLRIALWAACLAVTMLASAAPPAVAEDGPQDILIATHVRLNFDKDISRVAVGDEDVLSWTQLSEREGLLLGQKPGRTTLLVWFTDDTTETYLFHVKRDLSILEDALREIHPSITVTSAPDRDAVVLRGLVPDITYSNAAEETAQRYLDARGRRARTAAVAMPSEGGGPPSVEPTEALVPENVVINLIRVESLPGLVEVRMQEAVNHIGTGEITVRRLVRGRVPDDEIDIFVLEGRVESQSDLVRAISVARSFIGSAQEDDIRVIADESGALTDRATTGGGSRVGRGSPSLSNLFSSGSSSRLDNLVRANLGRAKVIEAADGRILSFIQVTDIPQVRVNIRLYEVNSSRLRDFESNWGAIVGNFTQGSLNPAGAATTLQGRDAARVGSQGKDPDIQNVLGFLAGTLSNQFQLSGDNFAIDSALSLLETRGWARSISRPSLTVLSGEQAFFQVGGEVPIPQSFATTATAVTDGVFNSVVFRPFGVQLRVRPLVGEDGDLTLDVLPEISLPDPQLTDAIRDTTGSEQVTTAFRTRFLQTTARLQDGQALLVGGLLSRNMSSSDESTPGLSEIPLIGGLFTNNSRTGDEIQLVVLINPVVVRKPSNDAQAWAFPDLDELMKSVLGCDNPRWDCR